MTKNQSKENTELTKFMAAGPKDAGYTATSNNGITLYRPKTPALVENVIDAIEEEIEPPKEVKEKTALVLREVLWNEVVSKVKKIQEQLPDEGKTFKQKTMLNDELEAILYANSNIAGTQGMTLMHMAAKFGWVESIYILAVENPHLINDCNKGLMSPFLIAITHGQAKAAQCLIEEGANINILDSREETALHLAVFNGDIDCVRLLLENGINIEKPSGDYIIMSPKGLCTHIDYEDFYITALEAAEVLGNNEIIKLIRKYYDENMLSMNLKEEEKHLELGDKNCTKLSELNVPNSATNSISTLDVFEGQEKHLEPFYNGCRELLECNAHGFEFETDMSGMHYIY